MLGNFSYLVSLKVIPAMVIVDTIILLFCRHPVLDGLFPYVGRFSDWSMFPKDADAPVTELLFGGGSTSSLVYTARGHFLKFPTKPLSFGQ